MHPKNLLVVLSVAGFCLLPVGCRHIARPPVARRGVMDLREYDFTDAGSVTLSGEWEVAFKQLLSPNELAARKCPDAPMCDLLEPYPVPRPWPMDRVSGNPEDAAGYATYLLRVYLPAHTGPLTLRVHHQHTAYRVFLNKQLAGEVGMVSPDPEDAIDRLQPLMLDIPGRIRGDDRVIDIVIQVSNYHWGSGGLSNPIELGRRQAIHSAWNHDRLIETFLFSMLLVLSVYHLLVFATRPGNRDLFYFSLLLLGAALRATTGMEKIIHDIMPFLPFQVSLGLETIVIYGMFALLILFLRHLFPLIIPQGIQYASVGISTAMIILFIIVPGSRNAWLIKLFAFFAFSIMLILIVLMARARLGGNRVAGYFLLAVVALTMAGLHDFLYSLHVFRTRLILPYAFSFVLAAMAFVLSRRYARALRLSEELLHSMESLVHTRTIELQEANSKLQKAAHEKDAFFRIVAHELRTPLTFLMGPLQSAMRTGQSISNQDAGDLLQGARRILRLLNQLLDIQRITAGKTRLEPRLISLSTFMLNITSYFTPYARGAQVEFFTDIPDYLPDALFDPEKLDRCIMNLLSNALKFTPAGGSITFNVFTLRDADTETEYLRVAVTDSGTGVPEERRRELFQSFSFSNKSLRNWSDGSGLGLSIVREYIELHNGFVRFEPADNGGARFYFQIPIQRGDDSTHSDTYTGNRERTAIELAEFDEEPQAKPYDTAVDRSHAASILVVDDEQLIHKYLGRILVQAGYNVIFALTMEEALTRLKAQTPRLIITDFVLPDQTGIEFIRHIRSEYARNPIPILMITADAHREVADQAMSAGAYAVLTKPFSDVELLNLVHRAIHVQV